MSSNQSGHHTEHTYGYEVSCNRNMLPEQPVHVERIWRMEIGV